MSEQKQGLASLGLDNAIRRLVELGLKVKGT
jgi:hypothetical protein